MRKEKPLSEYRKRLATGEGECLRCKTEILKGEPYYYGGYSHRVHFDCYERLHSEAEDKKKGAAGPQWPVPSWLYNSMRMWCRNLGIPFSIVLKDFLPPKECPKCHCHFDRDSPVHVRRVNITKPVTMENVCFICASCDRRTSSEDLSTIKELSK